MRKLTGRNGLLHANFLQFIQSLSLFFLIQLGHFFSGGSWSENGMWGGILY